LDPVSATSFQVHSALGPHIEAAKEYLDGDFPELLNFLDQIERTEPSHRKSPNTINVDPGIMETSTTPWLWPFDSNSATVTWDPHAALVLPGGKIRPAAFSLVRELGLAQIVRTAKEEHLARDPQDFDGVKPPLDMDDSYLHIIHNSRSAAALRDLLGGDALGRPGAGAIVEPHVRLVRVSSPTDVTPRPTIRHGRAFVDRRIDDQFQAVIGSIGNDLGLSGKQERSIRSLLSNRSSGPAVYVWQTEIPQFNRIRAADGTTMESHLGWNPNRSFSSKFHDHATSQPYDFLLLSLIGAARDNERNYSYNPLCDWWKTEAIARAR
jgi:hypothetical protein